MSIKHYVGLIALFLSIGACTPPTQELPDAGGVSPAVEELTESEQNLLRCDLNPIQFTLSTSQERAQFRRGCRLFFSETFLGNGRTCGTCHLQELGNGNPYDNNFDFGPADAEAMFQADPTSPLFRSIDSDDGVSDYTTLRSFGLARIPFVLPPNVTVREPADGWNVVANPDGTTTVFVLRSTPSSENTLFEENLMWDGREGSDLAHQAISAVLTHAQPGRSPTTQESEDIAFFQEQLFSSFSLRAFASGGPTPTLPTVPASWSGSHWDSVRRGRHFFEPMAVVEGAPVRGGHCATCHDGPMLNRTNMFNPVQFPGDGLTNNFVSETNSVNPAFPPGSRVGIQLPELTYDIALTYDFLMPPVPLPGLPPPGTVLFPAGSVFTLRSSDPGRILTTGDPCEIGLSCIINSDPMTGRLGTVSLFRISSLWGSADSAPYFHDNSAETLEDVMEVYRTLFLVTAFGTGNNAWILSPQEEMDIVNYMEFAFRHQPVLLP